MDIVMITLTAVAVGTGFLVRSVTGFAAALVALPILLIVLEPVQAVGLLSLFFFLFSLVMIYKHRSMLNKKIIMQMGLSIFLGMIVGIFLLKTLSSPLLLKGLGLFVLVYLAHKHFISGNFNTLENVGPVIGFVGGIFSALYAAGGSLYVTYLDNKFTSMNLLRANAIGVLGIADILRFPLFVQQGIITYDVLYLALIMLPVFVGSIYLGQKIHAKIDGKKFEKIVSVILCVSAVSLLF